MDIAISGSRDNDRRLGVAVERFVEGAAATLSEAGPRQLADYDKFPVPLYATDEHGIVTYFNDACADFAGRTPRTGVDRWCISWKLRRDDGSELSHDDCPMAVAVREARSVRGIEAFAERPDGLRRRFRPFPTPALDAHGRLVGAVNLLVPTDGKARRDLLADASRCRRLATWVSDDAACSTLTHMADESEAAAAVLRLD